MEEITVAERIKKIINDKKVTIKSIARTDTERVNITRQLNGQVKVSFETINRILEVFPDISAEWLLRGHGEMERTKQNDIEELQNNIEILKETIRVLTAK